MKFGICLEGTEEKFENELRTRAKGGETFVYLEIGIAHCETLKAVCAILATTGAAWKAIGIDPWIEARRAFDANMKPPAQLLNCTREEAFRDHAADIGPRLDFVFIDGCHSEKCATEDFLAVEPLMVPGGVVVFHDFWDGPGGIQPHCAVELGVIPAVTKLGLLDNTRPGWWRLPDWQTNMATNNYPCGVFEKV